MTECNVFSMPTTGGWGGGVSVPQSRSQSLFQILIPGPFPVSGPISLPRRYPSLWSHVPSQSGYPLARTGIPPQARTGLRPGLGYLPWPGLGYTPFPHPRQVTLWAVCLVRFPAGGRSCSVIIVDFPMKCDMIGVQPCVRFII